MSKVIIHIGPPKTATTSLQIALEQSNHPYLYYGGTFQPRSRNVASLSANVFQFCTGSAGSREDFGRIRTEIENAICAGKHVFISEEMLSLEQRTASASFKLRKLGELLKGFECRILITARPAKDALPSLYQEIFESLPSNLQLSFPSFCRDKRSLCYDYSSLCEALIENGFKDIVILEFDKALKEGINLSDLFEDSAIGEHRVILQRSNIGQTGRSGDLRTLPSVSLKNFGGASLIQSIINRFGMRFWPGYRRSVTLLERISLSSSGEKRLQVPQDVVERFDRSYQKSTQQYGMESSYSEGGGK